MEENNKNIEIAEEGAKGQEMTPLKKGFIVDMETGKMVLIGIDSKEAFTYMLQLTAKILDANKENVEEEGK
jgi:2,3-bisphosphoglycerate-independent phosphoglycerate mutase